MGCSSSATIAKDAKPSVRKTPPQANSKGGAPRLFHRAQQLPPNQCHPRVWPDAALPTSRSGALPSSRIFLDPCHAKPDTAGGEIKHGTMQYTVALL